jgi:RNA polymerase primary sigma factor
MLNSINRRMEENIKSYKQRPIKISIHVIPTIKKLIETYAHLKRKLQREPTTEEMGEEMEMSVENVRKLIKLAKEPVILEDKPIDEFY